REDAALGDPALAPDVVERRLARAGPGHLQRDVGLDRRREVGWALEPDRPGPVVAAPRQELARELAVGLPVAQAEHVEPDQVLRDHRRVRLELADPPAVGVLQLEKASGP